MRPGFQKYIDLYKPIMNAMHAAMGECSEFVLHDLSTPESSVVAVCGNVTNRALGAPSTNLVIETLQKYGDDAEDIPVYQSVTKEGKQLKSSTAFIRENGKIVGCFCCNIDLTEYIAASKMLQKFCMIQPLKDSEAKIEVFAQEISEVVEEFISYELQTNPVPVSQMTRADKLLFVERMENKGIFDVKGSAETVAHYLGVSVFTVYNYIKDIRSKAKLV